MPLIEEIDLYLFIEILILILFINYFLFRRLLLAFVDPIWFLVIINTTVTLTLVIYDRVLKNEIFSSTVLYIVLAHLAFILGARVTKFFIMRNLSPQYLQTPKVNVSDPRRAAVILKISTVFMLCIAAYYLATGLPALSSDPELARVLARKGGGGVVARLFNVFGYLSLTLWFYCRLQKIRLGLVWSFLGIGLPLFLLLFVGAKASLLLVYISLFYVSYYVDFESGRKFIFSSKYFFITAGAVLCVSFVLLFARAGEAGATDSIEFATLQLIGRIAFAGVGAAHYFSTYIPDLTNFGPFDYFYQYWILPLFGPLRIFDYGPTVGSMLAMSITGDDTFGPNPSMYVEGAIYFGRIFGVMYCAAVGVIFSVFRYLPLRLRRLPAFIRVTLFSVGNMLIMSMTYDMILFVGDLVNFLFFMGPILTAYVLIGASLHMDRHKTVRGG